MDGSFDFFGKGGFAWLFVLVFIFSKMGHSIFDAEPVEIFVKESKPTQFFSKVPTAKTFGICR